MLDDDEGLPVGEFMRPPQDPMEKLEELRIEAAQRWRDIDAEIDELKAEKKRLAKAFNLKPEDVKKPGQSS